MAFQEIVPSGPPSPTPDDVRRSDHDSGPRLTRARAIISGFILVNLVVILSWSLPVNSLLVSVAKRAVGPYMMWSGLWQGWNMFAPDVPAATTHVEAELIRRDGRTTDWKFSSPPDYGYYRRYFMERRRKFSNDHLRLDTSAELWPDAARYVARLNNDPANPVDTVRLVRYWAPIPPPGSAQPRNPAHWNRYVFFTYPVKPEDLR